MTCILNAALLVLFITILKKNMQFEAPKRAFLQVNFKPLVLEIYFVLACTGLKIRKKHKMLTFMEWGILRTFTPKYKWIN